MTAGLVVIDANFPQDAHLGWVRSVEELNIEG